ncbi:MAG: hypothetical protein JSW11_21055 [Candidatus Heimdallarchaeota archaeon]|nr:MAG: hypothetical protein JSW11_21055 [Candidatus Heimdallarchaeota archaeon]
MPKQKEPVIVSSNVWEVLLEIEALRMKERKLIRNLWYELKEQEHRKIHQMVFEQALQSNSAFPTVSKKELNDWVSENITTVFITLIEQGDIIVQEEEPSKPRKWLSLSVEKIKKKVTETRERRSQEEEQSSN